jgi:hypothetical protein
VWTHPFAKPSCLFPRPRPPPSLEVVNGSILLTSLITTFFFRATKLNAFLCQLLVDSHRIADKFQRHSSAHNATCVKYEKKKPPQMPIQHASGISSCVSCRSFRRGSFTLKGTLDNIDLFSFESRYHLDSYERESTSVMYLLLNGLCRQS